MKYLVLGSSGQIGKPLCDFLQAQGHDVTEFDVKISPQHDLRTIDPDQLAKICSRHDFVFFMAWDVGGSVYLEQKQKTFDFVHNNMAIATNVFAALAQSKTPFVFASSQMANMDHSAYGLTKSLGELLTMALNGLTVKFWNVYGYEEPSDKNHAITDFIFKAQKTGIISLRTTGEEMRQFLYADDCAECLYLLSQKFNHLDKSQTYDISSFEWSSIHNVANIVAAYFDDCAVIPGLRHDSVQQDKRNEPSRLILEHWQPRTSLSQGIAKILEKIYRKDFQ